jgi:asparagine synthase (glutamine-hydrolysing)
MVTRLRHRGPDQQESVNLQKAGLGIARLAINDLDGGHQPYRNEDGSVVAVFNGEIYNFRDLRQELEARGHRFRSQTDGEVIVHLFEEHGESFVERLNGMFAIALWDGQSLFLYRDRLGIKPLYLARVKGILYFASELKSLLEVDHLSRQLDHQALRSYLSLEYVPTPRSIFAQVEKMPQAHSLRADGRGVRTRRFWRFPSFSSGTGDIASWADRLRDVLSDSVKLRLVADVPVGVFLSGGLDSSTLTSMMCRHHTEPVHTFSVGFSQKSFDETSFSQAVANRLGTVHHHHTLDAATTLAALEPLAESMDEPLADPALIPTYLLAKFARQRVTVALAGEGADELLAGYPTYFAHQLAEPLSLLPAGFWQLARLAAQRLRPSREYLSFDFKLKKFLSGMGLPQTERHLTWMGSFPWLGDLAVLKEPAPHALDPGGLELPKGLVERAQTLDFHTYLADDLLVKLDRATMLVSLEGRVPFLDHRVVETMADLPTAHKLRLLDAKRVLKRVEGHRLPAEVLRRRKKGFGVPIADWLRGPLRPMLESYLSPSYLARQGLFQEKVVAGLVQEHLQGTADHRKPLWTLLTFQRWAEVYRPTI